MTYEEILEILSSGFVPEGCPRHEDDRGVIFVADGYAVGDSDRRPVAINDVEYHPDAQCRRYMARDSLSVPSKRSREECVPTWRIGVRVTAWTVPHGSLEREYRPDEDPTLDPDISPAQVEFAAFALVECTVRVDPLEPASSHDHDWMPPGEILADYHRVDTSHGGGCTKFERWCALCGVKKTMMEHGIEYHDADDESRSAAIQYQARKLADAVEQMHEEYADAFLGAFFAALQERVDLMGYVETAITEHQDYWARFVRLAAGVSGGSVSNDGGAA